MTRVISKDQMKYSLKILCQNFFICLSFCYISIFGASRPTVRQLENLNPYASDTQPRRYNRSWVRWSTHWDIASDLLAGLLEVRQWKLPARIYSIIMFVTYLIQLTWSYKVSKQVHQVMVEVVDNSLSRSFETDFLKPYLSQENLKIGAEEALDSFNVLAGRFKVLLEVLGAMVALHEVIFEWSTETSRVTQLWVTCSMSIK